MQCTTNRWQDFKKPHLADQDWAMVHVVHYTRSVTAHDEGRSTNSWKTALLYSAWVEWSEDWFCPQQSLEGAWLSRFWGLGKLLLRDDTMCASWRRGPLAKDSVVCVLSQKHSNHRRARTFRASPSYIASTSNIHFFGKGKYLRLLLMSGTSLPSKNSAIVWVEKSVIPRQSAGSLEYELIPASLQALGFRGNLYRGPLSVSSMLTA